MTTTDTAPQPVQQDPAEQILRSAQGVDDATRANAWDAFHQSKNEDDLTQHLQNLNIPQETKAGLWDAKHSMSAPPPAQAAPPAEEQGWFHQNIVAPLASAAKRVKDAVLEGEGPGYLPYDVNQLFNPTPAPPAATDQEAINRLKARNASTDPQQVEIEKDAINKLRSDRQFEARNAKEYAEGGTQLIHPEKLLTPAFAKNNPVLYGLSRIAGSLTTKENAELLMGSGGLGAVGEAAAVGPSLVEKLVSYAPRLVSAYFAGMMGVGAASYIPGLVQAKKDYDAALASGDQAKADDILWHAKEQTTEAAASAYMSYAAAYHATTGHPDPIGKTVSDAYDMAKSGAVAGAKGAIGLAGDAGAAAWEKATSVQKLVSGKANSVPDAILAASNVPQKLRPAHLEKIKDVGNDLDYILNNNPNIVDPATAAKAIRDNNQANENSMLAKAGATQGSTESVVPNFEKRLGQRLDKYFADNAGKFGTPEEEVAAKKDIIDRTMRRVQTGVDAAGNPVYTPRSPNLFEAEGIRQGLNIDAKPRFGANAQPTSDAYKNGAFEAANFLREVIDEAYHDKGVEGVKEFRQKEAKLIDVADRLDDAQGKALERGEPGWGKAVWSKFGTADAAIGIATGLLTGSAPAGVLTAIPGIIAHKAMQERTSPIGNINRAIDLAAENPGAKATEVTVKPPTTPPTGPPAASVVPPISPVSPAPANTAAPVPVAPITPTAPAATPPGINHKLYSALSSHYGKVIGSVPFEDLENRFMADVSKATETGGGLSDRQQKLLETVNDAKAEQRLNAEKEQKAAADKAQKEAQKAAADQAKAAEKAQKEQQKEAEKVAKDKEEKAALGLNTNVAAPFNVEDEIDLPKRYQRMGYSGARVRAHELGHQVMVSFFGHPTGDIISHNHAQIDSGALAEARWDKSKFQDENGEFTPELIAQRLPELIATYYGGPVAEELVHNVPMESNAGARGDIKRVDGIMKELGLDPTERARISKAGEMAARKVLTTPGVSDIIRRYTNQRQAGIGDDLHMTPETVGKAVEEVKHAISGESASSGAEGEGKANEPNVGNEEPAINEAGKGGKQAKPGGKGERTREAEGAARTAGEEGVGAGGTGSREPRTEVQAGVAKNARGNKVLDRMKEIYGTSNDASDIKNGAGFITPEGEFINLPGGVHHPDAIEAAGGPKWKESDNRPAFMEESGAIRIRHGVGRAGSQLQVSVPPQGVTPEQVSALKRSVSEGLGRTGNLYMERGDIAPETKDSLSAHKTFVRPFDVDTMLQQIDAHPDKAAIPGDSVLGKQLKTNISHEGMQGLMESRRAEGEQPDFAEKAANDNKVNGGFTIHPRTGVTPTEGHIVEIYPEARRDLNHQTTAQDIRNFYNDNRGLFAEHPELHIGGYGRELNVTGLGDEVGAPSVAQALDQHSIYDLANQKEIKIGGKNTQREFPNYPLEQRIKDLHPPEPAAPQQRVSNTYLGPRAEVKPVMPWQTYSEEPGRLANAKALNLKTEINSHPYLPDTIANDMEPDELEYAKDKPQLQKNIFKEYNKIKPSIDEMANVAKAGGALGGWWQRFMDTFKAMGEPNEAAQIEQMGPAHEEALKAFHGALSGNKAVEHANKLAWNAYHDWLEQGRPRDRESIDKIIAQNGKPKGVAAISDTHKGGKVINEGLDTTKLFKLVNSPQMRDVDPMPFTGNAFLDSPVYGSSSGAKKIPSMVATTAGTGNLNRVVFDTHMKDIYNQLGLTDAKYIADSIHVRRVARELGLSAGEAQEQIWGTVLGMKQLLGEGLTPEEVANGLDDQVVHSIGKDYAQVILEAIKNDPEFKETLDGLSKFGFSPTSEKALAKLREIVEQGKARVGKTNPETIDRDSLTTSAKRLAEHMGIDLKERYDAPSFNFGHNVTKGALDTLSGKR